MPLLRYSNRILGHAADSKQVPVQPNLNPIVEDLEQFNVAIAMRQQRTNSQSQAK